MSQFSPYSSPAAPNSEEQLPKSLQYIVEQLSSDTVLKPANICRIVRDADVQAADLLPWADFDHPVGDSYGRQLVYQGPRFEVMVMSWDPGDFSTIHDHGGTQWGAVQIFGEAEHATFRLHEDQLTTLARWRTTPGDIIGVSHNLLHQMGNPFGQERFVSLHVYGQQLPAENITGDARIMELYEEQIHRVDGGVFFALPPEEIKLRKPGLSADFPTRLRHLVELTSRLHRMHQEGHTEVAARLAAVRAALESPAQQEALEAHLQPMMDSEQHTTDSSAWRLLNTELQATALLQQRLESEAGAADSFHFYASLYDELIGEACYKEFMGAYFEHAIREYGINLKDAQILSAGCGTGLVESRIIEQYQLDGDQLYGIDLSKAMIREARKRIHADVGNVLELDPSVRMWDIVFSGLNVYHYVDAERLEDAIAKTAAILKPNGWFIGDFITPDHIRWYPNVLRSSDEQVISVRTPRLVEQEGRLYQESEISIISFRNGRMEVKYAGKHYRFLPPLHRVRQYFERYFEQVHLFEAISLKAIPDYADTCPSTRYVVVARR